MEVAFATRKLDNLCNSQKNMRGELGPRCAARLGQRLAELEAASTLEDVRHLPGARCHELTGDRKGQLAVDLVHPLRLIFAPDHDPRPERASGDLDWSAVTKVVLVEIVDYH